LLERKEVARRELFARNRVTAGVKARLTHSFWRKLQHQLCLLYVPKIARTGPFLSATAIVITAVDYFVECLTSYFLHSLLDRLVPPWPTILSKTFEGQGIINFSIGKEDAQLL